MKKIYLIAIVIIVFATGCPSTEPKVGKIRIQNKIPYVTLNSINFGDYYLASYLQQGATSSTRTFDEPYLPYEAKLQFTMNYNGDAILLESKKTFKLKVGMDTILIINPELEVVAPLLNKKSAVTLKMFADSLIAK